MKLDVSHLHTKVCMPPGIEKRRVLGNLSFQLDFPTEEDQAACPLSFVTYTRLLAVIRWMK